MSERTLYWRGKLAELESSGLSRAAFCRRHRINYQTMSSWVKRFRDEGVPASGNSGMAGFVEVSLPVASAPAAYEVLLGNDRSIRVGGDFDGAVLARLIRVVVSC